MGARQALTLKERDRYLPPQPLSHPHHQSVSAVLACRICAKVFWSHMDRLKAYDR